MRINDANNLIDVEQLDKFLQSVDSDYIPTLKERGINTLVYARKLASLATICYEQTNDVIIAIVAGYTHNIERNTSYITIVGCRQEYRREGVTSKLIKSYIEICKNHSIDIVRTTTHPQNFKAQKFYESCGFVRYDGGALWGNPEKIHYKLMI